VRRIGGCQTSVADCAVEKIMAKAIVAEVLSGPEINADGSITSIVKVGSRVFRFTHHGHFITHPDEGRDDADREALAAAHRKLHEYLAENPDALRRVIDRRRPQPEAHHDAQK
jgi:hypothetical protein